MTQEAIENELTMQPATETTETANDYWTKVKGRLNLLEEMLDLPATVHKAPEVTPEIMAVYLEQHKYCLYEIVSRGDEGPIFEIWGRAPKSKNRGLTMIDLPLRIDYGDWIARCSEFMRACTGLFFKTQLRVWYELTLLARQAKEAPGGTD